jgi:addiction module RelE/StbE family toxin
VATRKLVLSSSFKKSYQKFTGKQPHLITSIQKALVQLEEDAFSPKLKTHKLSGSLYGLMACNCGYDCRIVFSIEKHNKIGEEIILLVDIGTHEDVY